MPRYSSFSYDTDGNVLTITDNESNKLTYRYDSNGNLTEEYGPTGKAIKYSYTNNTQLSYGHRISHARGERCQRELGVTSDRRDQEYPVSV